MPGLTTAFAQGLAAARPAAATSNAGYVYFSTDTGILSQSTGSSWTTIGPAVALDALTTKADLLTRTSSAYGRLGVGSNDQVLTADSTASTGLKWATSTAGFADPMTTRGDLIVRGGSGTTRLALGSSGQYLKSDGTDAAWAAAAGYTQGCRVTHNATQSVSSGGSLFLAFNTEDWDTDGIHDTVTNNTRLTCQTAGKYLVYAGAGWTASPSPEANLFFRVNGTQFYEGTDILTDYRIMNLSLVLNLSVSDYVEVRVVNGASGSRNIATGTNQETPLFGMQRIG